MAETVGRFPQTLPEQEPGRRTRLRHLRLLPAVGLAAAAGGAALLARRIVGDIDGKPLFEDEAVTGLVAALPFDEMLATAWWERGAPPLHYVLSYVVLLVDPSPEAVRWLSAVFAIATVPLVWDLGRRLGGHLAGGAAALVLGTSSLLWVYGSFGRMYAVYLFASTLALDLFVRALGERTPRAALAAALAAWLVAATHTYGIFLVVAEALVALSVWRGRPLRPAWPVVLVGVGLVPFLVADVRLADRFSIGLEGESRVAQPGHAWAQVGYAFEMTVGSAPWVLAAFGALALAGAAALLRGGRFPVAAVFGLAALLPLLLSLARTSGAPALQPRHIAYLTPVFAALVGLGLAAAVRRLAAPGGAAVLAAVGIVLALNPQVEAADPRNWENNVLGGGPHEAPLGGEDQIEAPAAWLDRRVAEGAVLFPYSPLVFGALPAVREADVLPYAQSETVLRALDRVDPPVPDVFVSVPLGRSGLAQGRLERRLGPGAESERFGGWFLIRREGPFEADVSVVAALHEALAAARDSTGEAQSRELRRYYEIALEALCGARASLGDSCASPRP